MDALAVTIRLGLYLDLGSAFGVAFFALLNPAVRSPLPLRITLAVTAVLGIILSAFSLAVMAASMAGVPLAQVDMADVTMVLTGMSLGTALLARVGGLAVVAISAIVVRRRPALALIAAVSGGAVAVASLAWAGHGVMDEGSVGWLHLGADIAHLIAASAWLGALVCLLLLVVRPLRRSDAAYLWTTHSALDQFSLIGTIVVAVIVVTGIVNAWLLIGPANVGALLGSLYGQLLIGKLVLFAAMLGFAAVNRYRLTPALASRIADGDHQSAIVRLRTSVALETGCAVAVFALVAWLGTLEPLATAN